VSVVRTSEAMMVLILTFLNRHDDITYQSIAKAFGLPLVRHKETFERMKKLSKPNPKQPNFKWDEDSPALQAKLRMVDLPIDESKDINDQVIFPQDNLWVPVSVVNGNVHILPGVPRLCKSALTKMVHAGHSGSTQSRMATNTMRNSRGPP
jgi:molybdopterin-biosynthesis enzyme MoeA-like protein